MDKKDILIVCFLIFYVLVLGIGIAYIALDPNNKKKISDSIRLHKTVNASVDASVNANALGPNTAKGSNSNLDSNGDNVVVYDLVWDKREGGYMIHVQLGHNTVPMVFDSGSSILSAKSAHCTWQQCDDCDVSSCPCEASIHGGAACGKESYL